MGCIDDRPYAPTQVPRELMEQQRQYNRMRSLEFATMLCSLGLVERDETDEEAIARMDAEGGPPC